MDPHNQAKELAELVYNLTHRFQMLEQDQLCCYDLTASECHTLRHMKRNAACDVTMHKIAEHLNITRSGATRLVDKLIHKGYALRRENPNDGRVCCIVPTPAGKDLMNRIEHDAAQAQERVLKKLDSSMRQVVIASLQALETAIQQARTEEKQH